MSTLRRLAPLLVLAAGVAVARGLGRRRDGRATRPVRDAGPKAMSSPPADWDQVDEQADESFPASDPPGNY